MMRLLGFNSRIAFLLTIIAVVLTACSIPSQAASSAPAAIEQDKAVTGGKSTRGSAKAPPQLAAKTKASSSTVPAGGQRAAVRAAAPGNEYRGEIAAMRARLDRQEQLLAAQQQQIAKLVVAVDELKGQPNRSLLVADETGAAAHDHEVLRLVSYKPDPAPKGGERAATSYPQDPPPVVKSHELLPSAPAAAPDLGEFFQLAALESAQPLMPASAAGPAPAGPVIRTSVSPNSPAGQNLLQPAGQEQTQPYITRLETLSRRVEGISQNVAGFRFSGDLRLRGDGVFRSSDKIAGPEQNVRGQYRARLNLDKGIDKQLNVHFQLGSGRFDNPLTDDTDMGGGAVRGPIFLTEAWANYHPSSSLSFQGGKMPEVFQDGSRFLWDEDVRFDGFQQTVGTSPGDNPLGITRIDLMAGQYILTNPNIQVLPTLKQCTVPTQTITSLPATITTPAALPAACAYLQAGYQPGENVRAADMFDQGVFLKGRIKSGWSHYMYTNMALFRNPNQIALMSTSEGLSALVNPVVGSVLNGPLAGTGSATTMPGGGIYTADHYQVAHLAYRITKEGWMLGKEEFPVFLDLHASRNVGTSFQRNAWMATLNAGQIKKRGDVRFLYFYAVKEANSMISQFTDDRLGTNVGVNVRTHSIRLDVGLASFLQWQNLFYIQNEISPNDPARHFYVPIQQGARTQYRAETDMFVNF
jgi:hypothetical protein